MLESCCEESNGRADPDGGKAAQLHVGKVDNAWRLPAVLAMKDSTDDVIIP